MVLFLIIAFGLAGILIQRSKILTILIYLFTWTLMWTRYTADFSNYAHIYMKNDFRDGGFAFLCGIGNALGLEFFEFYLALGAIAYFSYCLFTIRYCRKDALVAGLYLLFISWFDIVQFRNFVAFSIVLFAIPLLFKTKRLNILIYSTVVVLASFLHITVIFYLVFAFMNRETFRFENFKRYIIPFIFMIVFFYLGMSIFLERAEFLADNYSAGVSAKTKFFIVLTMLASIAYIWWWNRKPARMDLTERQMELSENPKMNILFFNLSTLILMPIAFQSMTIFRLYKYLAVLNFGFVSNKFAKSKDMRIVPETLILVLYGASYLGLFIFFHLKQFLPNVVRPILYHNEIYSLL